MNKITFYTVDAAGHAEAARTVEVRLDKTAPVTASDVPSAWAHDDVTVTLTATDAHSGVAKTYYSINGAEFVEGTSFTVTEQGVTTVTYYTVDAVGNREAAQTAEVKIQRVPPTVEVNLQDEYPILSWFKPVFTVTNNVSPIVSEKMTLSGPLLREKVIEKGTGFWFILPGTYTLTVTVTDEAGMTTTVKKQFVVYVPIVVDVTPGIIKSNNGEFTVRAKLPVGYVTEGFDLNSVTFDGVKALSSSKGLFQQAKNGQFKFNRADFDWTPGDIDVEFRGNVHGILVIGHAKVKVK